MSPPKKGPFKRKIIVQPQLKMENSTIIPYINQPPFLGWRTMIQRDANVSEKNIVPLAKPGSSSSVDVWTLRDGVFRHPKHHPFSTPKGRSRYIYILLLSALPTHIYIYAQSSKIPARNVNFHECSIPFLSSNYLLTFNVWKPRVLFLPKNNIAPENHWLEDIVSFWGPAYCQGANSLWVSRRGTVPLPPFRQKSWGQTKNPAIWRKNNL